MIHQPTEATNAAPISGWRIAVGFLLASPVAAFGLALAQPAYDGLDSYIERVWRTALAFWIVGGVPASLVMGIIYETRQNRLRAPTIYDT